MDRTKRAGKPRPEFFLLFNLEILRSTFQIPLSGDQWSVLLGFS
jgi:hypothetical protein